MIPDSAMVLRRRHTVVCLLRAAALVLITVFVLRYADHLADGYFRGWLNTVSVLIGLLQFGIYGAAGLAFALFSSAIARWIVPPGLPDTACPGCGYSIGSHNAPICPECGIDLRPSGPSKG